MNFRFITTVLVLSIGVLSYQGFAQSKRSEMPERVIAAMSAKELAAYELYLQHHAGGAQKTTGTAERLIALYKGRGSNAGTLASEDSTAYSYSGSRGANPRLTSMTIDNMKMDMLFNSGINYVWNSIQARYFPDKRVLRTFDAFDRPVTYTYQKWDGSSWNNVLLGHYAYNASGNDSLYKVESWNAGMQVWTNSSQHLYAHNTAGDLLSDLGQVWNSSSNSWENGMRLLCTYDAAGRLSSFGDEYWNTGSNTWIPGFKDVYTYTAAGKFGSLTSQNYNSATSTWENSYRQFSYYNAANNEVATLRQNGNGTGWDNADSSSHRTLNAAGLALIDSFYSANAGVWQFRGRNTNAYTAANLISTVLNESWVSNSFVNDHREFSFYDSKGQLTRYYNEYWKNGAWSITSATSEQRYYYESYTTTGVGHATAAVQASLYPVPATHKIKLAMELNSKQQLNLSVYDATGKLQQRLYEDAPSGKYEKEISVSALPAGLYYMQVTTGNGSWSGKFMVQH